MSKTYSYMNLLRISVANGLSLLSEAASVRDLIGVDAELRSHDGLGSIFERLGHERGRDLLAFGTKGL